MVFRASAVALWLIVSVSPSAWAGQARIAVLRDPAVLGEAAAQRLIRGFREANMAVAAPSVVMRDTGATSDWLQCLEAGAPPDHSACAASPVLPVDAVAAAFLDRLGSTARVVVARPDGTAIAVKVIQRRSQLALLEAVEQTAAEVGAALVVSLGADRAFAGRRRLGWGVVAGAGLVTGVAAVFGGIAVSSYGTLTSAGNEGPRDAGHALELQRTVASHSTVAITAGAVGLVATGVGLSLMAAPFGSELTQLSLAPAPGGAVIAGRFP